VSTRSYFWERRVQKPTHERVAERRRAQRQDNTVRIDVHDEGPGVAPEDHMDIFSEFMRSRTGPKVEGIGLGLAIAKRLIDAHAGKIWVESGPQSGTTFSFLLPTS
jgi:signal transduction histidine kinase